MLTCCLREVNGRTLNPQVVRSNRTGGTEMSFSSSSGGAMMEETKLAGEAFAPLEEPEVLGIHSEMSAWGQPELIRQGVFNGKRKTLHPGKVIYTALDGAGWEEYIWMSDNPLIEMYDCEYVHNPTVIAQNENMVSINSILQVDLTGQITCETQFGPRIVNGPGGQLEFHLGAVMSKGGRAISLLRSLAFGGSSTIVPQMPEGSLVTIPRQFADYVVTEYGIASLGGKSHRERANELIAIAHPDFRAELKQADSSMFYP